MVCSKSKLACVAVTVVLSWTAVAHAEYIPVTFRFNMPHIYETVSIRGVVTEVHQGSQDFLMDGPNAEGLQTITLNLPPGTHSYAYQDDGPAYYRDPEQPPGPEHDPHNSFIDVADPMVSYTFPVDLSSSALREGDPIRVLFEYSAGNPINPLSLGVTIDGDPVISPHLYYDALAREFSYTPAGLLAPGEHSLRIQATSAVGSIDKTITFIRALDIDIQNAEFVLKKANIVIYGELARADHTEVDVYVNGLKTTVPVVDHAYAAPVELSDGENLIRVESTSAGGDVFFERVFQADLPIKPVLEIVGSTAGRQAYLEAVATSPLGLNLTYLWSMEPGNPVDIQFNNPALAQNSIEIPQINGEYYARVTVTDENGQESYARVFVKSEGESLELSGESLNAAWIDKAIVYELTTSSFSDEANLNGITARLDEITELGANTLYIMPVFETEPEENCAGNYEMVDYFRIGVMCGTEQDFRDLVDAAHDRDIKVLIDLTFNHTSDRHPFMLNADRLNGMSPYKDFYIWEGTPGESPYAYSGWTSFALLNVSEMEVQQYFGRVAEYWIDEFDVDGYRLDTAHDPYLRDPEFWVVVREYIKRIKPEALIMAEANVIDFHLFKNRFDTIYDPDLRVRLLELLRETGSIDELDSFVRRVNPPHKFPTRYADANNYSRLAAEFSPEAVILAHALVFTINGIPRVWAGAEYGATNELYDFDTTVDRSDPHGMRDDFIKLLSIRKKYIKNSGRVRRVSNSAGNRVYSYFMRDGATSLLTALNFDGEPATFTMDFVSKIADGRSSFKLNINEEFPGTTKMELSAQNASEMEFTLPGYGVQIFSINAGLVFRSGFEEGEYFTETEAEAATFPLDPRFTYLRSGEQDDPLDPLIIDLEALGYSPGTQVSLARLGFYQGQPSGADHLDQISGVFSSSPILLERYELNRVPGAIKSGEDFSSSNTCTDNPEPTDIPQDFLIDSEVFLEIPLGAKFLFIGVPDCYNGDNEDPNDDFGFRISPI